MPQVAVGAIISGISAYAAGAAIGTALLVGAGSLVLGGLSYALTPKPKMPRLRPNGGQNITVRQSDLTRQFVYGHTRITRGYAHMQSTGINETLHQIIILCEGPLRAINEVWVNDYCIPNDWINDDGEVIEGRYAGFMTIRKHLGTSSQGADSKAVADMEDWTNSHKLQGIAYLYVTMTKDQDVYPTGAPNFSAIVEGPSLYDPRTGDEEWSTNIALYSRDFITNSRYGFEALEDDLDDTNIAAQASICDEIVDTQALDMEVTGVSIDGNRLGLDGDILKFQFGDRVQLVTSGTPPGGLATGTSYYVIPYQVKGSPRIQLATSLANAMNKVAINITSSGSGDMIIRKTGEPRYHGSGVFDTETTLSQTLNDLVNSMAGRAICIGGFWTLLAGAWRTPDLSLGIEDIRNNFTFKNDLSLADSFNVVKGTYNSQLNYYQTSDYPSARYEQFIDEDNGIESTKEINLPFTGRPTTAQRIAKIELFKGRQGIAATAGFSAKAMQVVPGNNIELTIDRVGWEEKAFEVTTFALDVNDGTLLTQLSFRETALQIFDWTDGEAIDFDPAPNTNLPSPFDVIAPSGVGFNSRIIVTTGGDTLYVVQLQWNLHPDSFVREFGDFEVQYKPSSQDDWLPSFFVDGELTETDVFTSSAGLAYDMRILARNNLGVRSAWSTLLNIIVGSSGGVTVTDDWGFVYDAPINFKDWGSVTDAPTITEDWGYVV